MALFEKKVQYRIRVFDSDLHIITATVPDKGQRFIPLTIHAPNFGLFGEKTRLAFMINPKIKPKIFGRTMEIDFDIRDSVQFGDLLDLIPDLVIEINENYRKIINERRETLEKIIDADFSLKTGESQSPDDDEFIKNVTDPVPVDTPDLPGKKSQDKTGGTRPIDTVAQYGKDAWKLSGILYRLHLDPESETNKKMREFVNFMEKHPNYRKTLYWIPDYLGIGPEIHALVSQTRIVRTGIDPIFYKAQSDAPIAEKALTKPKQPEGWQNVAIVGLIVLGIIVSLFVLTGKIGGG